MHGVEIIKSVMCIKRKKNIKINPVTEVIFIFGLG